MLIFFNPTGDKPSTAEHIPGTGFQRLFSDNRTPQGEVSLVFMNELRRRLVLYSLLGEWEFTFPSAPRYNDKLLAILNDNFPFIQDKFRVIDTGSF